MFCPSCGKSIEDNIAFCTHCAARLPRNAEHDPAIISESPQFAAAPLSATSRAKKVAKSAAKIGAVIGTVLGIIAKGKLITKLVLIAIFAPILALVFGAVTFFAAFLVFKSRSQ